MRLFISVLVCMLLASVVFAASSSQNYNVQSTATGGGENVSGASYSQIVVVGIVNGMLESSSYLNQIGLLHTIRQADGLPCTLGIQCEGGYCCSSACSSSSCPVPSPEGSSGGGGGGGGGGGALRNVSVLPSQEELAEIELFSLSPELLRVHLLLGQETSSEISIRNTANIPIDVQFEVQGVDDFFTLEYEFLNNLTPFTNVSFYVNALGRRLGSHFGEIIASAEGISKSIDILLEVESAEALFDVKLDIPRTFKALSLGEKPRAQLTFFNLRTQEAEVTITYLIKDARGIVHSEESETLLIDEESSFVHEFPTTSLPLGKYLASAEVRYQDQFAVSSDIFTVVEKSRFEIIADAASRNVTFVIAMVVLLGAALLLWRNSAMRRKKGTQQKQQKQKLSGKKQKHQPM